MSKGDRWIIESGFSCHMIGDKSKFETMEQYKGSCVKFGNDAPCLSNLNTLARCLKAYIPHHIIPYGSKVNYNYSNIPNK